MFDAALARRIRLVGFEVDGVLTAGSLLIGAHDGRKIELKRFDSQDGAGAWLLRARGVWADVLREYLVERGGGDVQVRAG